LSCRRSQLRFGRIQSYSIIEWVLRGDLPSCPRYLNSSGRFSKLLPRLTSLISTKDLKIVQPRSTSRGADIADLKQVKQPLSSIDFGRQDLLTTR
jgi:hypothetical protein